MAEPQNDDGAEHLGFSEHDVEDIEEAARLRAPMIYEVVRREGEEEMRRPLTSLWWSGVAAGLSISFSVLAEAILRRHLPDTSWRPLVAGFGYSVGFLIVVLARQQLFTENTITVVLPIAANPSLHNFIRLGRMWSIVFVANMVGTLFAALFCTFTPVLSPGLLGTMRNLAEGMMSLDWGTMFFRGISAGFLIAAMVWLIPSAEGAQFLVITLMTWLIAIGGFTHIVVGSMEAFLLVVHGDIGIGRMFLDFFIPALLGNVIGGTVLFGLISYAQVAKEV
ncbi:MAG: formate/nitrite transporter family protein [Stellaceae bacterium]